MSKIDIETIWKIQQDVVNKLENLSNALLDKIEDIELEVCLQAYELKKMNEKHEKLLQYLSFMNIVNDNKFNS